MTGRSRRRTLTPDEVRVWRSVADTVHPLPGKTLPEADEDDSSAVMEPPESQVPVISTPPVPRPRPPAPRVLPDLNHGTAPGLDKRSANRMKKGEMDIEARLDLHGMTQDTAHGALIGFVSRAFDSGKRCILVITGKGTREGSGVLRANVPRWLNQSPCRERILSFSYARPQHGGDGALYVLIKRQR